MTSKEECGPRELLWRTVIERAQERALHSRSPVMYMRNFEMSLKVLRRDGTDTDFLDRRRPVWEDTVHVASEIEALSAFRAMRHWGKVA